MAVVTNEILQHSLRLSILLRDVGEEQGWHDAWTNVLAQAQSTSTANTTPTSFNAATAEVTRAIADIRSPATSSFKYHPVLFTYFVSRYLRRDTASIMDSLTALPELRLLYERLHRCLSVFGLIFGLLRQRGTGYPHSLLPYTKPLLIWNHLERVCEVPWPLSIESASLGWSANVTNVQAERFLPGKTPELAEIVNHLGAALENSNEAQQLAGAYNALLQSGMRRDLQRAKAEFDSRYQGFLESGLRGEELGIEAFAAVLNLYFSNQTIRAYVEGFEAFESMLQRVYWLLSQAVFFSTISCLTTGHTEQLQQVIFTTGKEARFTAIAPTRSKTLRTGQLIHASFPEAGKTLDGIYQIDRWNLGWHVSNGACITFRANRHWSISNEGLNNATSTVQPLFVPADEDSIMEVVEGYSMALPSRIGDERYRRLREMSPRLERDEALSFPFP
jgi:hypothetical protein